MIGVIIFGGHKKEGYVIDYIAIESEYRNNSFGPLSISFSQTFTCQIIKKKCFGKCFKRVHTAYLACIKDEVGSFMNLLDFIMSRIQHHFVKRINYLQLENVSILTHRNLHKIKSTIYHVTQLMVYATDG